MDKYKVLKRIGVGTYGSAYLVSNKNDPNRQHVLKKVKVEDGGEKERLQAEKEAAVLMQLDHPLVLSYVDHFMYKGHLCIITDYCEAGDMCEMLRLRKTPLPETQILDLLAQILLALQYVHSKSILHRDLKTANIFLTKEGTIKLGDFGISRSLSSSLDLASTIIGTPYYMSPEVMSSQPYDFKSDMWSLGCCLYEMMTLKHAFDASDLTSLVLKVMRGEHLPIPDQFSPGLRDLVKQLLSKAPKLRPSSEQCLKSPLLKEYTARAKEKVAWLEQQKRSAASRVARPLTPPSDINDGLDIELLQAKERLRRIQAEREAIREQGLKGVVSGGAGPAPAVARVANQGRRSSLGTELCSDPLPSQPVHGRSVGGNAQQAAAAGRPMRISSGGDGPPGGVPLLAAQGTPPRPVQAARMNSGNDLPVSGSPVPPMGANFRRQTYEGDGGLQASPSQGPEEWMGGYQSDPKARKEARRKAEILQREAELLEARKAYFEERRTAEAKKHLQYQASATVVPGTTGTRSLGARGTGSKRLENLSLHDSENEEAQSQLFGRPGYSSDPAAARQEFESELAAPSASNAALMQTFSKPGAGLADRAAALRSHCCAALGQPLYELIYAALRRRVGGGVAADEAVFRKELQNRLGPSRMQYVHLLDQIIYLEDCGSSG